MIKLIKNVLLPNLMVIDPSANLVLDIINGFLINKETFSAKSILNGLENFPIDVN
jgi:hypothetical protein